jgi:hypothetical protein
MSTPRRHPGAPRLARHLALAALAAALPLALPGCGGGGPQDVAGCVTDPECGAGAYCAQGTCRASAPPVAGITLPPTLASNRALTFQAAVTDPDPGDGADRHDWTVALVAADCAAEPEPTTGPALQVVFWCPGTFDVTLVATDRHGVASTPVTRRVEVAASQGVPAVAASSTQAPLGVGHRCAGEPLACQSTVPIVLAATGTDPGGGALTYAWRARPLNPRVADAVATFSPSAALAGPTVRVTSPGTALAGDWVFTVRAESPAGLLARAAVTVPVTNRPPEIAATPIAVDHTWHAGVYEAAGTLVAAVSDPDGDPVETAFTFAEPAGSGCLATLDAATHAFALSCTRAASLIGEVGREAQVTATDVNGDAAQAAVVIEIRNRPPVIRLAASASATQVEIGHGVGACLSGVGLCYRVDGEQPFLGEDPDGDPVAEAALTTVVAAGATASQGQVSAGPPAAFHFATALAAPGEFRTPAGASPFSLLGVVADPFGATASAQVAVRVGNRPPQLVTPAPFVAVDHRYDAAAGEYLAVAQLGAFADPDGDPIDAAGEGPPGCTDFATGAAGALTVTCRLPYRPGAADLPPLASFLGQRTVVATAGDGWETASAASAVTVLDRPPTLASTSVAIIARCQCLCPTLRAILTGATAWPLSALMSGLPPPGGGAATCTDCVPTPIDMVLDPGAEDPDGDPLLLGYVHDRQPVVKRTAIPAKAPLTTIDAFPTTWQVTADDGGGGPAATGTVIVTEVACP